MTRKQRWISAAATAIVVLALLGVSAAGVSVTQHAQLGTLSQIHQWQQAASAVPTVTDSKVVATATTVPEVIATATTSSTTKGATPEAPPAPVQVSPAQTVFETKAIYGQGLIQTVQRVCGQTAGWQKVAAANNIQPPAYFFRASQQLTIDCTLRGSVVVAAAPAPAPPQAPPPQSSGWTNPLPGKCVSSGFGWRNGKIHNGVDLMTPVGTDVIAAAAGTAYWGDDPGGAGWYLAVDHGNGVWTTYFHLSDRYVGNGAWVNAGQVIAGSGGRSGAPGAGNSSGPHLHFEVHPWGKWTKRYIDWLGTSAYVDPIWWLNDHGVPFGRC